MMKNKPNLWIAAALLLCIAALSACSSGLPAGNSQATAALTPSAAVTATAQGTEPTATPAPVTGLVLIVPVLTQNVEVVQSEKAQDGTYREELLYDQTVRVVTQRLPSIEHSEAAVLERIETLSDSPVTDLTLTEDSVVAGRLSYPAWRAEYTTGSNEDTRTNVDLYIQTDSWDLLFHADIPVDLYEQYSENVETWIESLDLFE